MKQFLIFALLTMAIVGNSQDKVSQAILFQDYNSLSSIEDKSLKFYTNLIEEDPSNVKALVQRSELNKALGRQKEAENDMQRALNINPYARIYNSTDVRLDVFPTKSYSYLDSKSNVQVNNFEKDYFLSQEYRDFLKIKGMDNPEVLKLQKALMYTLDGEYTDADAALESLDPETKTKALYYDIKGILELEKGSLEKSIAFFTLSIKDNPYFVIPYYNRGIAYKKLGMLDRSEEDFYSAISLNADIAKIHFSKAKLLEMKKDIDGATYYYQNAMEIDQTYVEAAINYSVLLKTSGEYTHAMVEIEKSIKEHPDNENNYYVKGGLNFIFGEYGEAIKDFDIYLRENSDDSDALFSRGLCKILVNEYREGCIDLKESLEKGYDKDNLEMVFYLCND